MRIDSSAIQSVCIPEMRRIWLQSPDVFPDFLCEIPDQFRSDNEKFFRATIHKIQKIISKFPVDPAVMAGFNRKKRLTWKKQMTTQVFYILKHENALGIHRVMSQERIASFYEELEAFIALCRSFSPELNIEGIGQAIRNYTVYAMFVELSRGTPGLNPAAFGYSMLYPFTDNYIDSSDHSDTEKKQYNQMIRETIAGREVEPLPGHQEKTIALLRMIAEKYPREKDGSILTLLQMMQEAQENSLRQQRRGEQLPAAERLDISLFKGGLSVLIDRCFVDRELSIEDMLFYFGFGFFLQLADDLQDIGPDFESGHQTLLNLEMNPEACGKTVNKLFWFVREITESYVSSNEDFKQFVLKNCYMLLCTSVIGSKEFFSHEYTERLQKYMPVSGQFWESSRSNPLRIGNDTPTTDDPSRFSEEKMLEMLDVMIGRFAE